MPEITETPASGGPRIGSLCSGYRGLDAAVEAVFSGTTAWVSDIDPGASAILAHHWPDVPNLGDIAAVDWAAQEPVDILTAGFPCQDVSLAGLRAGLAEGTRSGLWRQVARAIRELQPRLVVIENVRGLLSADAHGHVEPCAWCVGDAGGEPVLRALGAVLGDLAGLGFDAEWQVVRASDVGAPHQRERAFVIAWPADAQGAGLEGPQPGRGRSAGNGAAPAHPDDLRGDGREARPGEARRQVAAGHAAADPRCVGRGAGERHVQPGEPDAKGRVAADTTRLGRGEGRPEPARLEGRPRVALGGGATPADTASGGHPDRPVGDLAVQRLAEPGSGAGADAGRPAAGADEPVRGAAVLAWGNYEPAIRRWERALGRDAPAAVDARNRLSPVFVEWLMGLPEGHVTAVPGLSRTAQLKALGNGVVPQQAEAAIRMLLGRLRP